MDWVHSFYTFVIAFECVLTFHFCEFAHVQWGGEGVGVTVTSLAPDLYCLFDKQWKTQAVGCVCFCAGTRC